MTVLGSVATQVVIMLASVVLAAGVIFFGGALFEPGRSLVVLVSPESPVMLGERLQLTVMNASSSPVYGATVEIKFNANPVFSTSTDEAGHAFFEYPGQTTMISVSKEGYTSAFVVVPKTLDPPIWSIAGTIATIVSVAAGSATAVYFGIRHRKKNTLRPGDKEKNSQAN